MNYREWRELDKGRRLEMIRQRHAEAAANHPNPGPSVGLPAGAIDWLRAYHQNAYASLLSGLGGAAGLLFEGDTPERSNERIKQIQRDYGYEPRTLEGQAMDYGLDYATKPINHGIDLASTSLGDALFELTGRPEVGAAGQAGVKMLPALLTKRFSRGYTGPSGPMFHKPVNTTGAVATRGPYPTLGTLGGYSPYIVQALAEDEA